MARTHVLRAAAALTFALSGSAALCCAVPVPAFADETSAELQTKLDEAKAKLEELSSQAAEVNEQVNDAQWRLNDTNDQIEQTSADIEKKREELSAAQSVLSGRVHSDYKTGGVSMLSVILGSSSFEDLLTRVDYANRIARSDANVIAEVKSLESDLEQKQSELQEQKDVQEQTTQELKNRQAELNRSASSLSDYTNSLDQQVKDKLQEEQEAERKAAEERAKKAAEEAEAKASADASNTSDAANSENGVSTSDISGTESSSGTTSNTDDSHKGNTGGSSSSSTSGSSSSNSTSNSAGRSAVIAKSYAIVASGASYVYGAEGPDAYDCSGLVMACYAAAGVSVPHSSGMLASYCNKPTSQAQPGDIVWRSGHVGIYIGNGTTIEAFTPSMGIGFGSLSSFVSCGSPL